MSATDIGREPAIGATSRRRAHAAPPPSPSREYDEGGRGFSLALLLALALMIPGQFSVTPAGLHLTPLRLTLLLLAIPAAAAFLGRRPLRVYAFDVFYFAFAFWTALCMVLNRGVGPGVERGGQFILETAVIYLIFQGSVRTLAQIRLIYAFFLYTAAALLLFAIPEIALGEHYLQNFFNRMTGLPLLEGTLAGERLGVTRVTSIFSHPILYGLFNASLIAMLWYLSRSRAQRIFAMIVVGGGAVLSLSSGPILVTAIQMAMIAVERFSRWLRNRARYILGAVAALLAFVQIASDRGLFVLIVIFTLEPASAYHRRLIWEHGVDDVLRNPIFGMLPELWTRPFWMKPSIDNFWLFQAMQGGAPSVLFLALAILLIVLRLYRAPREALPTALEGLRRGWLALIVAMVLCGATVHFFDKLQPYFAFVIATGAAAARLIADWERGQRDEAANGAPDGAGRSSHARSVL